MTTNLDKAQQFCESLNREHTNRGVNAVATFGQQKDGSFVYVVATDHGKEYYHVMPGDSWHFIRVFPS